MQENRIILQQSIICPPNSAPQICKKSLNLKHFVPIQHRHVPTSSLQELLLVPKRLSKLHFATTVAMLPVRVTCGNLTEDEKIEYICTRVNGMGSDNPFCIPFDAPVQVEITGDFDSATYCQTTRPTAGNVCPCVDNPRFEFELKNVTDTVQNCAWLTTKKSKVKARKDAYCLQYANRYACAKSCGTCGTVEPPKSSCDTSTTTKSTEAPKSTTKAPKKSTKAPKKSTKAPKSTTKAPAATPQGGSPANSSSGSSNDVEMAATVASAAMAALVLFGVY